MKKCKRNKAQLGLILGIASTLLSAGSTIGSAISNKNARDEADAQQNLIDNLKNASLQQNNIANAYNSAETETNDNLRTLHSSMKCGGKKTRVKKACGGRSRYI